MTIIAKSDQDFLKIKFPLITLNFYRQMAVDRYTSITSKQTKQKIKQLISREKKYFLVSD